MVLPAFSKPISVLLLGCVVLQGCSHAPQHAGPPVVLVGDQINVVAQWHDMGAATVLAKMPTNQSDAEKYSAFPADLATMHLAIYDASMAITPRYRPYLYKPAQAPGASIDAAVATAAYEVLRALFPTRAQHYQSAYEQLLAAVPDGAGKTQGIALGAASAAAHLERRAGDGRATARAPYAANTGAGRFRGADPVMRFWPDIKPFTLTSIAQFRPPPPPALDSAQYAADFNEVKELGGKVSTRRTDAQFETARFHSEMPGPYFTRNFGRFARTTGDPVDAARLMAAIYTNYADAIGACIEAKYHYDTWRPQSAIPLADTDGNPATIADPAWTPVLPTPPHPEYPAAHSCSAGTTGELLRRYYGTDKVTFTWDSGTSGTTRTYSDTEALAEESKMARIWGGMHFRYATGAGAELGKKVARWTMEHAFMPQ